MEYRIVPLVEHAHLIPVAVDWIIREWPGAAMDAASVERRLCGDRKPLEWPSALVALADEEPAGVVSLTHYEPGVPKGRPHWIDAVYVAPPHRGAGVATRLIAAAEAQAARLGASHLHALTEIPRLYLKSGWSIVEEPGPAAPRDFVMGKALPPAVTLRPVTADNYRACVKLDAGDGGRFVAPNAYSLVQAQFEPGCSARLICAGETPVGFALLQRPPDRAVWVIVRFMLDRAHQRRGYGRAAMMVLLDELRRAGGPREVLLSTMPDNRGAQALYESLGFRPTGEADEGEPVYRLAL